MVSYRFLDALGQVVAEGDYPDHGAALEWARLEEETADGVNRVEYFGPDKHWRWAGPLQS